jgi:predicted transcriptional regulator of viral defense system
MSTLQKNITAKRIAILNRTEQKLFHIADIAVLWDMQNPNTLRVTLKRYCDEQLLYRTQKGLYSLILPQRVHPILLGVKVLHKFTYLTTESILYFEGYVSQVPSCYTFVGSRSVSFSLLGKDYKCRQLRNLFLFNPLGIKTEHGVKKASTERAIADLLYFYPLKHFDKEPDWKKVQQLQQQIGYPLTPQRYASTKS